MIFACGRTWLHSFREHFFSDIHIINTKLSLNVIIYCYMLFDQIRLGGTSWNMKLMPDILSLVPLVNDCPTRGILIGTLVWEEKG